MGRCPFRELQCLIHEGDFECVICGRFLRESSLAEANRHCHNVHGVNLIQYYKMVSGKSQGNDNLY